MISRNGDTRSEQKIGFSRAASRSEKVGLQKQVKLPGLAHTVFRRQRLVKLGGLETGRGLKAGGLRQAGDTRADREQNSLKQVSQVR